MQIKDRLILKIQSIAFGGHGVGRADGFVIFVPFTAPEEVVEIEIVERRKKFARGHLLKILEPSRERTRPLCRYYGRCGGCSYQHIEYDGQLKIKQKQVEETFSRIGGLPQPPVSAVIPSPQPYAYRGKAVLHAAKAAEELRLGFMDVSGGRIVDVERCEIMDETINDQIRRSRMENAISAGDDIIFWSGSAFPGGEVVRSVQGREFLVPRLGFFQANLYLTDRMVEEVSYLAGPEKRGTIVDACCGSGLFSVFLAPYARRIIGIEINEKSVKYARENAERQGVQNAEFIQGDVEDVLKDMSPEKSDADLIILDPPRTGLAPEALTAISRLKLRDIIYISCNPASQARDVKFLNTEGYDLLSLQPLDMFPQTEHIETIGLLRQR